MFKKLLILAGLGCVLMPAYFLWGTSGDKDSASHGKDGTGLVMPVPPAVLKTPPLAQKETITIDQSSAWDLLNPFAIKGSKIELEAKYRHRIELKNHWNFVFDPARSVAFVVIPGLQPDEPVEFQIMKDKKVVGGFDVDSKWFWRFEDPKQIHERMELLKKLNEELVTRAASPLMVDSRMAAARLVVEAHIRDWLIAEGHCTAEDKPLVKVFTVRESDDFPVPGGRTLREFKP
jgi:hypothetical protein